MLNDPGLLFLKCFSDKMPGNRVIPRLISEKIIKGIFEQNFIIEDIPKMEFKNDKNLIKANVYS